MDVLIYIKRLMMAEKYILTQKAADELAADGLSEQELVEAVVFAKGISKVIRSKSIFREESREKLYIIKGRSLSNAVIYTKGVIRRYRQGDVFYVLVSSKRSL